MTGSGKSSEFDSDLLWQFYVSFFTFIPVWYLSYRILFSANQPVFSIPLVAMDWGDNLHFIQFIEKLIFFVAIFLPILGKYRKWIFLLLFFSLLEFMNRNFSRILAFESFPAILALLGFVFEFLDKKNRVLVAQWTLALIFIAAGVHKINSSYLSGYEFVQGNFYLSSYLSIRDFLNDLASYPLFLWITILTEVTIGILILLNVQVGILLGLIFTLFVSLFLPIVMTVFLELLPLCIVAGNFYLLQSKFFKSKFIWLLGIGIGLFLTVFWEPSLEKSFINFQNFIAFLLIVGLSIWLIKHSGVKKWDHGLRNHFPNQKVSKIWISGFIVYVLLPLANLIPTPLGFSFFAGDRKGEYKIYVSNVNHCEQISRNYNHLLWESRLIRLNERDDNYELAKCIIFHSSVSGLNHLIRESCDSDSSFIWYLNVSDRKDLIQRDCESLNLDE